MSRLPASATRIEGFDIDARRELPRLNISHRSKDIDSYIDDIVFNVIDIVQERRNDNEIRIFAFNLLSKNGYENRDMEDLVKMMADLMDIGVTEGRFRDAQDAVQPIAGDVLDVYMGHLFDEFPELEQYIDREMARSLERANRMYVQYEDALELYRRNGGRLPSRGRRDSRDDYNDRNYDRGYRRDNGVQLGGDSRRGGRDRYRDDRDGRDDRYRDSRDRDREYQDRNRDDDRSRRGGGREAYLNSRDGGNRDTGRSAPARRDEWNRGAIQSTIRMTPRNAAGSMSMRGRFEDSLGGDVDEIYGTNNDNTERRNNNQYQRDQFDREDRRSRSTSRFTEERHNDREVDPTYDRDPANPRMEHDTPKPQHIQRLPTSSKLNDIEDALAREEQSFDKGAVMNIQTAEKTMLDAFENQDAWIATREHPHPLAINHQLRQFYKIHQKNNRIESIEPVIVQKGPDVNYHDHESIVFGAAPTTHKRFSEDELNRRHAVLKDAVNVPVAGTIIIKDDEGNETNRVMQYQRQHIEDVVIIDTSIKSAVSRVEYLRMSKERQQQTADSAVPLEIASVDCTITETFVVTKEEREKMEHLRRTNTFIRLSERMVKLSKELRPGLFLQLDRYLAKAVNHMLRQYLSIPSVKISSFADDMIDLLDHIEKDYGTAYTEAVNKRQVQFIEQWLGSNDMAEAYAAAHIREDNVDPDLSFLCFTATVQVVQVNETSFNLDVDLVADVASLLKPEVNPFLHALASEQLGFYDRSMKRCVVATSDGRVLEVSRSFIVPDSILVRLMN